LLNESDDKLIKALTADGRMSWVNLAKTVNLSPSACQRRVEALQASGIIRRFTVDLDDPKMGRPIRAFIQVKVQRQDVETAIAFRKSLSAYPEVQGFYKLSGNIDYLVNVSFPDIQALSDFIDNQLLALEGVVDASSAIVLDDLTLR